MALPWLSKKDPSKQHKEQLRRCVIWELWSHCVWIHKFVQIYRCYRSDPALLTDLVRCQVIFVTLKDMKTFIEVSHSCCCEFWLATFTIPHAPCSFASFCLKSSHKVYSCVHSICSKRTKESFSKLLEYDSFSSAFGLEVVIAFWMLSFSDPKSIWRTLRSKYYCWVKYSPCKCGEVLILLQQISRCWNQSSCIFQGNVCKLHERLNLCTPARMLSFVQTRNQVQHQRIF